MTRFIERSDDQRRQTEGERLELEAEVETVEEIREGLAESWRVVEERGI